MGSIEVAGRGSQLSTKVRPEPKESSDFGPLAAASSSLALGLGAFFGLAALVRDAVLYRIFSFYVYPDTGSYLTGFWQRSRPYPVMGWITDAMDHPERLVWLQLIIGALATGSLVWVIARRNPWLASLVGVLFVLDLNWAITNRELLSEGALMSFSVLSLAVLGYQYDRRAQLNPIALVLAGMLFAWTCTIRPSNLYLMLPIAAAYLFFTRSMRKAAWLSAGMVAVLLASSWLTLIQTGKFRVSGGIGYYVAFPLFSYHLFSASNGPASARIDAAIRTCDPNVDYSKVVILTSNQYLWGDFFTCLRKSGWSDEQTDSTFTSAYVEAVKAHPAAWFESWAGWFGIELGYPLSEPTETTSGACDPTVLRFCSQWEQELASRPAAMEPSTSWELLTERLTDRLRIVYASPLIYLPNPFSDPFATMDTHSLSSFYVILIIAIWLGVVALIWFRTRGTIRVLALGSVVAIVYVCATIPAGHVFLPRYVSVLSPIQTVLSAVVIFAIARLAVDAIRRLGTRRVATIGASAAAFGLALYFLIPPPVLYLIASRSPDTMTLSGPYAHEVGSSYVAYVPSLASLADNEGHPAQSTVRVYENGHQLGPPHTPLDEVGIQGQGRFSHMGGDIYFSASDNTDPNVNGRSYTVTYLLLPSLRILVLGYIAAAIVLAIAAVLLLPQLPMWQRLTAWLMSWRRYPAEDVVGV